jgi:hypothetical protein
MKLGRTSPMTTKPAQAMASLWCAYRDHRPATNSFRLSVVANIAQEPGTS